ncbi:hypothetical protein Salat_1932000 [Sesamum alatum]|uniref:Uncharacterized protein n=1 Tax=Sesamum alatum TaxID=300844 RepID=A0AAE1Y533_9LAMI|nr:hypothetical protein Salat_1932000 [Sesamum alatum]
MKSPTPEPEPNPRQHGSSNQVENASDPNVRVNDKRGTQHIATHSRNMSGEKEDGENEHADDEDMMPSLEPVPECEEREAMCEAVPTRGYGRGQKDDTTDSSSADANTDRIMTICVFDPQGLLGDPVGRDG